MHKKLCFTLLLGSASGLAIAQSSVAIGGKIDLGYGRYVDDERAKLRDAAGSRLNFRGQEDLGGGWIARFALEHRFEPGTGLAANPDIFWQGYSTVGIGHRQWGTVNFGRQYTAAYSMVQNVIDPWGGDTVAQLRTGWRGGISKTRVSNSIRYDLSVDKTRFAISTADSDRQGGLNGGPKRPFSIGANSRFGPLMLAIGWEDPGNENDHLFNVGGTYYFGPLTLALGYGSGSTTRKDDFRSALLAATYRQGASEIKVGVVTGKTKKPDGSLRSETRKFGLGYFHHLSRRTFLYANLAHDSKATKHKVGYDLGLQHNF
ncbi:MAG: porin [Alcaligenaceae bacterium]|nr:MAG: porin [Alcaligenaceae bacterium]